MKRSLFIISLLLPCLWANAQQGKMDSVVTSLMSKMTIEEKIGQLNLLNQGVVTGTKKNTNIEAKIRRGGVGGLFGLTSLADIRASQEVAVRDSRLHIPLFFGLDIIHGYRTVFPIPLAMSCSWDMDLIKKSAQIAASEATANGINLNFSPMVDISRDPRWGRVAEGSGEDPYLGALIAQAMVEGYQGNNLSDSETMAACIKHFALYGAVEAGREYNSVDMSKNQMFQYYFAPYKAGVDAGAATIMSAFNDVNGVPATANKWLLTDVLREEWGFEGAVISDYTAVSELTNHGLGDLREVSAKALRAGVDQDMVSEGFLTTLRQSLDEGKISESTINNACRRVLELKYKLGLFEDPFRYLGKDESAGSRLFAENRELTLKIAKRSIVLLKNETKTLPLKKKGTIALIGPLADNQRDLLGTWVTAGYVSETVTLLEGMKKSAGNNVEIHYAKGANITDDETLLKRLNHSVTNRAIDKQKPDDMLAEAVVLAKSADVVVAVLGESWNMSGEAASRSSIGLPTSQKNLLKALIETGKPVVLVLVNGRPLTLPYESEHASAILETFAGGTEAGNAIAQVLFGEYNPSGKLTMSFPRNVGQIPVYYNHKNTGRPYTLNDPEHTSGYLDVPNDPLYPFGFGLSYTKFKYGEVELSKKNLDGQDTLIVSTSIKNVGDYAGEEIVQLYISDPVASIARAVKELKRFKKIELQPGEEKQVSFVLTSDDLKFYNDSLVYDWEAGRFIVHVGTNSVDVRSAEFYWQK